MARYPVNLPVQLKQEAEQWAARQGVSLNQFILWAVAEKVGGLKQGLDDPAFPSITYRRGASGVPSPVVAGTRIRVQTIVSEVRTLGMSASQVSYEHDLPLAAVQEALAFYDANPAPIDAGIAAEAALEANRA